MASPPRWNKSCWRQARIPRQRPVSAEQLAAVRCAVLVDAGEIHGAVGPPGGRSVVRERLLPASGIWARSSPFEPDLHSGAGHDVVAEEAAVAIGEGSFDRRVRVS